MAAMIAAAAEPPPSFRVVQWNIGHFALGQASNSSVTAEQSESRAAEYREMISRLDADFLGVCEYDPVFDKAGTPSSSAVFASFPTMVEGPKRFYQCNAVFGKLPCIRHEVVDFAERSQKTYFLDTVFAFGTNEVHFVQTHLDWNSNPMATDARPRQIRQLIDHFEGHRYVIIAGDWNVCGAGEYYPFRMAGYELANCGEAGCLDTFPKPDKLMPCLRRCLDNIVVKGFRVCDVFIADEDCRLSDHRIIGCTLDMK